MKLDLRILKNFKRSEYNETLQMLTCYDYQTAKLLNSSELDLILVGDSLGNVVLGLDDTIGVTVEHMVTFGGAVKRGAPNKFVVCDMPFGSYATVSLGIKNAIEIFQKTKVEALKIEGAFDTQLKLIKKLTETGIPVMGHIGLTPQSVHQQGGYYTHGKSSEEKSKLLKEALALESAGCFSIVLECVTSDIAEKITRKLKIPTIGIGSGKEVDGQVLVINDLLGMSDDKVPSFVPKIGNLYQAKKDLISTYLGNEQIKQ